MKNKGFALLGLILALAVIIILTIIFIKPLANRSADSSSVAAIDEAKRMSALNNIKILTSALDIYKSERGDYPTTGQGLAELKEGAGRASIDPWGRPFIYKCPGEHNAGSFDLVSYGKDGKEGGEGGNADISNY